MGLQESSTPTPTALSVGKSGRGPSLPRVLTGHESRARARPAYRHHRPPVKVNGGLSTIPRPRIPGTEGNEALT